MVQTNPPRRKPAGNANLKMFLATLSVTTTLSGWALFALNQPKTTDQVSAADASAALQQPTAVPSPTPARALTQYIAPQPVIPPLYSLPVRGLPEVGAAVAVAPQPLVYAAPAVTSNAGRGGGGGGGQYQAPPSPVVQPPPPAPRPPPPPPVGRTKGSHP